MVSDTDITILCQQLRASLRKIGSDEQQSALEAKEHTEDDVRAALQHLHQVIAKQRLHKLEKIAAKVGDVVEKLSPVIEAATEEVGHHTSAVWAAFVTLLSLAGARSNVFEAVADVLMYITDNLPRICTYIKAWRSQAIDNLTGTIANPAAYALRDIVKYLTDVADIMSSRWKPFWAGLSKTELKADFGQAKARLKDSFLSADFQSIANNFKVINVYQDKLRMEQLLHRLHTVNFENDLKRRQKDRLRSSCKWSKANVTIQGWLEAGSNASPETIRLWLHGDSGTGKSVVAGYLIKQVHKQRAPDEIIMYFFCDGQSRAKQTAETILKTLIVQMLKSSEPRVYCEEAMYVADEVLSKSDDYPFSLDDLWDFFVRLLGSFTKGSIILDGLNECHPDVLGEDSLLSRLCQLDGSRLRLLILSQDVDDIRSWLGNWVAVEIGGEETTQDDLRSYVLSEVEKLAAFIPNLPATDMMVEAIYNAASGAFRYVQLLVDKMKRARARGVEQTGLADLPEGLQQMYHDYIGGLFHRPPGHVRLNEVAVRTLQIMLFIDTSFTLNLDTLRILLAIHPSDEDISEDRYYAVARDIRPTLRQALGVLLDDEIPDAGPRFAHQSVKDFLLQSDPETFDDPVVQHVLRAMQRGSANCVLTMTCCTILASPHWRQREMKRRNDFDRELPQVCAPYVSSSAALYALETGINAIAVQAGLRKRITTFIHERDSDILHQLLIGDAHLHVPRTFHTEDVHSLPLDNPHVHRPLYGVAYDCRASLDGYVSAATESGQHAACSQALVPLLLSAMEQCAVTATSIADSADSGLNTLSYAHARMQSDLATALSHIGSALTDIHELMSQVYLSDDSQKLRFDVEASWVQAMAFMYDPCNTFSMRLQPNILGTLLNLWYSRLSDLGFASFPAILTAFASLRQAQAVLSRLQLLLPQPGITNMLDGIDQVADILVWWLTLHHYPYCAAETQGSLMHLLVKHPIWWPLPYVRANVHSGEPEETLILNGIRVLQLDIRNWMPSRLSRNINIAVWLTMSIATLLLIICSTNQLIQVLAAIWILDTQICEPRYHSQALLRSPERIARSVLSWVIVLLALRLCVSSIWNCAAGGLVYVLHVSRLLRFRLYWYKQFPDVPLTLTGPVTFIRLMVGFKYRIWNVELGGNTVRDQDSSALREAELAGVEVLIHSIDRRLLWFIRTVLWTISTNWYGWVTVLFPRLSLSVIIQYVLADIMLRRAVEFCEDPCHAHRAQFLFSRLPKQMQKLSRGIELLTFELRDLVGTDWDAIVSQSPENKVVVLGADQSDATSGTSETTDEAVPLVPPFLIPSEAEKSGSIGGWVYARQKQADEGDRYGYALQGKLNQPL